MLQRKTVYCEDFAGEACTALALGRRLGSWPSGAFSAPQTCPPPCLHPLYSRCRNPFLLSPSHAAVSANSSAVGAEPGRGAHRISPGESPALRLS